MASWAVPAADSVALLTVGLLALAAWSDLATRTIPNCVCIALALLGVGLRGFVGLGPLAWSVGVAVLLFAMLVVLHARGALGGGDVKLAAAMALGLSPLGSYRFITATALAGGVIAVLHLLLRQVPPPSKTTTSKTLVLRRIITIERWRIRRRGSLPYGVAIACGGAWVVLRGLGG